MSWIERAKIGDRVVCVSNDFAHPSWTFIPNRPVCGQVCTIRDIQIRTVSNGYKQPCLLLDEIQNPIVKWWDGKTEGPFPYTYFRPVKDTTLQVEALKRLCLTVPAMAESPTGRSLPPFRPVGVLFVRSKTA